MKSFLVGTFSVIMIVILVGGFTAGHFLNTPPSNSSEEIIFEVEPGKSFGHISQELAQKNLINNAKLFKFYAMAIKATDKMKVGEYSLRQNMTPAEVLNVILSGKSIQRPFTVSEGLNIFEIAELFEKSGFGSKDQFLELATSPELTKELLGIEKQSLEGYLFPETYQLTKYTTAKELIVKMVQNFKSNFERAQKGELTTGWTQHEIMTLASIIEKETGAPEERPLISSVFHNRLKKGMLLQTDPTIIYGMAVESKQVVYNITKDDIRRPSAYNTYVIKGLPPGPIANPGIKAIEAAMNPENSKYLFFVSQNDGRHVFSENYLDHEAAVKKFQLDRKAREGKSWRDLSKETAPETVTN